MGIPSEFCAFFMELAANNHKEWFDANRKRYETDVKAPFHALLLELITAMQSLDPLVVMQPKEAVFRINRDIRFSKDKSPYKLHMAAHISSTTRKDMYNPGLYVQCGPQGAFIAAGLYQLDRDGIENVRIYIMQNAAAFKQLKLDALFVRHFGAIQGEKNKIIHPELREAANTIPEIYHKQFYYTAELDAQAMLRPDFSTKVLNYYKAALPMNAFLRRAVND